MSSRPLLDANGLRQALRIATGATLGFTLCKLMDWPNGIFYTVNPMLLLGLVPVLNLHVLRQLLASTLFCSIVVLIFQGLFGNFPVIMMMICFVSFVILFYYMSIGSHFLFGATGALGLAIQLNFASYVSNDVSIYPLIISNALAMLISAGITALMHVIFPDVTPRPARVLPPKAKESIRHEVLLCSITATLSFVVFQLFDLKDSLSAQAASVLILFSLCWKAAGMAGWQRAIGTLIGCNLALAAQLLLLNHSNFLLFPVLILWLLSFVFSRLHMLGGGIPGIGFGVLTTFGILFGQSLAPNQDLVYSALYRFTSVCFAMLVSLCVIYVVHKMLNRFSATRHHTYD